MQIVINGIALGEFDAMDADEMEKLEKAMEAALQEVNKASELKGSSAETMRAMCRPVHGMFDNVFGPESSEKLFDGKCNLEVTLNAFAQLAKLITDSRNASIAALDDEIAGIGAKYSPNRAARRTKKK